MLADSKLPTIFWAEAANTACYVPNRVLVVKPHNTPYELFHGRTPTLSFMRPFGCHVIILNIINHLGKFDGKADEGFFVGYSLNSKAFIVFNSKTRIMEENLHIRFSKSTPNVVGSRPDWLFDIDALTKTINYEPIVAGTQSNGFADPKSSHNDGSKSSSDDGKMVDEDPRKENEYNDQEKEDNVNNTNNVLILILNISSDDEDDGTVDDMNNLDTTIQVCPILTTRIHKDHPLDQEEPKKVIHALKDPIWIEAMQKELLQIKLQEGWTLVDLPNGKKAIGTKWVSGIKDEMGLEVQLHARVDGKEMVITESSVRRDLQLADEEGDRLVRAATTASSLEAEQDSGNINKTQSKASPNESSSQGTNSDGGPRGNTLRSDEDSLKLNELMKLCTNLENMVLDTEKTKTSQRNEINNLKRRVKKLKKRNRSRTHKLKRLYKVGLTARVESSRDEESLGEDASKQGRKIDVDHEITLVNDGDNEMFDVDDLGGEEVVVEG
uniref:Ribonuclease H-like domain-containing protein n=1 Tax=Tanacetum cinerariifolium TaxID=118510 RepID=A0A6L2KUF1_TANCI|nr:ribonuclease H-like domain-containing protein [Tanacetum cinerariifolium]